MRLKLVWFIAMFIAMAFAMTACGGNDLRTELDNANAEIDNLRAELDSANTAIDSLLTELNARMMLENTRTELEGTWGLTGHGQIRILGQNSGAEFNVSPDTPWYTITFSENRFEVIEYFRVELMRNMFSDPRRRSRNHGVFHPEGFADGSEILVTRRATQRGEEEFFIYSAFGTFSISDDTIEFIYADGTILVASFRSTENTLTIGSDRDINRGTSILHRVQQ